MSSPDQSAWWGPQAQDEATAGTGTETGTNVDADQPAGTIADQPTGGGSFWDRIEDATQDQPPADASPRWETSAEPVEATSPEVVATDPVDEESSEETSDATPTVAVESSTEPDQPVDEIAWVANVPEEHRPETASIDVMEPSEPRGESLIAELDSVGRHLADARQPDDAAFATQLSELRRVIEDARDRPREIDAMLAISDRLETITDLLAANERMATAIDRAVRSLRGADPT